MDWALHWAEFAARQAGEIIRAHWGQGLDVQEKRDADLLTQVDLASERKIRALLGQAPEKYPILGEEYGHDGQGEWIWYVDPVDGTTNLAHGFDHIAVSIALMHRGRPMVAVVYNPIREQCFRAMKGKGAFLNGSPIRVSQTQSLRNAMVSTGFPTTRRTGGGDNNLNAFVHFAHIVQALRRPGSAALDLAGVAAGWFDGYWEPGLHAWDTAAGWLLVEEAGGKVTQYNGSPFDPHQPQCLASNGLIHREMIEVLMHLGHR